MVEAPSPCSLSGGASGIQSEGQQHMQRLKCSSSSFSRPLFGDVTAPGSPPFLRGKNASGTGG
eukprot:6982846-Alexandrium_andersonii.AAC.1